MTVFGSVSLDDLAVPFRILLYMDILSDLKLFLVVLEDFACGFWTVVQLQRLHGRLMIFSSHQSPGISHLPPPESRSHKWSVRESDLDSGLDQSGHSVSREPWQSLLVRSWGSLLQDPSCLPELDSSVWPVVIYGMQFQHLKVEVLLEHPSELWQAYSLPSCQSLQFLLHLVPYYSLGQMMAPESSYLF